LFKEVCKPDLKPKKYNTLQLQCTGYWEQQHQKVHRSKSASTMKSKSGKITRPEPSVEVGPVNNVLSSLFESMQMQINDRQITESGRSADENDTANEEPKVTRSAKRANIPDGDYPYRCYLNTLLYPSVTRLDSIANGLGIKQNGSSHDAVKDVDVPGTLMRVRFTLTRS